MPAGQAETRPGGADTHPLLTDPEFLTLLRRRSRLRWWLAGGLTGAYFAYGLGGLYAPELFAYRITGSVSVALVAGYAIIGLGIGSSIYYVRQVNRLIAPLEQRLAGGRR